MGNIPSGIKINHEFVQHAIDSENQYVIINVLSNEEQHCLIKNTIKSLSCQFIASAPFLIDLDVQKWHRNLPDFIFFLLIQDHYTGYGKKWSMCRRKRAMPSS